MQGSQNWLPWNHLSWAQLCLIMSQRLGPVQSWQKLDAPNVKNYWVIIDEWITNIWSFLCPKVSNAWKFELYYRTLINKIGRNVAQYHQQHLAESCFFDRSLLYLPCSDPVSCRWPSFELERSGLFEESYRWLSWKNCSWCLCGLVRSRWPQVVAWPKSIEWTMTVLSIERASFEKKWRYIQIVPQSWAEKCVILLAPENSGLPRQLIWQWRRAPLNSYTWIDKLPFCKVFQDQKMELFFSLIHLLIGFARDVSTHRNAYPQTWDT